MKIVSVGFIKKSKTQSVKLRGFRVSADLNFEAISKLPLIPLITHEDPTCRLREGYVSIFVGEIKTFNTALTQEFSMALYIAHVPRMFHRCVMQ